MTMDQTTDAGVTVLAPTAEALGGPEGTALAEALRALGAPVQAVVDLGAVRHMNSSGLGMLVGAMTTARRAGGDVRLARLSERLETLLRTTRLLSVFETFETVEEGVASFAEEE